MRYLKSAVVCLIGLGVAAGLGYLIYMFLVTSYIGNTVVTLLLVLCGLGILADIVVVGIAVRGIFAPPYVEEEEPLPPIDLK